MKAKKSLAALSVAISITVFPLTVAVAQPDPQLDHYLCHKTKLKLADVVAVSLIDQFDEGTYETKIGKFLCTPANKNDEGVIDEVTHLTSYKLKGPHVRQTLVHVENQFGTQFFDTKKTDSLLVPANKAIAPADPPQAPDGTEMVDHYRCLKAKNSKQTAKLDKGLIVSVQDQFGQRDATVKKISRLCVPADKNGEGINNPLAHLACYKIKPVPKMKVEGVQTADQFGNAAVALKGEKELCLPSWKNPECGDGGINQATEECDGADLAGETCQSHGFGGGVLTCNADCTTNVSECCFPPVAGDNSAYLQTILDEGKDLVLCPGAVYPTEAAIGHRISGQQIYTAGLPTEEAQQARLENANSEETKVINLDACGGCDDLQVHHLTFDGRLDLLGPPSGANGGLIDMGGGSHRKYIGYNHVRNGRGVFAVVINQTDLCADSLIEHNVVGPSLGDGIASTCYNSEIAYNTIIDSQDVSLNLFGTSGSRVHHNTIIQTAGTRVNSGLNMVDSLPEWPYAGTEVFENTIRSEGGRFTIGMAMGPNIWFCSGGPNDGASVFENHLEGSNFGFGYVLNGVTNWDFHDNTADITLVPGAVSNCGTTPPLSAFACQRENVNGGVCPAGTDVVEAPLSLDGLFDPVP